MNEIEVFSTLARTTLVVSIACVFVLVCRNRLRSVFGSAISYIMWLVVPAVFIASFIPPRTIQVTSTELVVKARQPVQYEFGVVNLLQSTHSSESLLDKDDEATRHWLSSNNLQFVYSGILSIWLAGLFFSIFIILFRQFHYRKSLGQLQVMEVVDSISVFVSDNKSTQPALVGVLRPFIVLPSDFYNRYTANEQAFIINHERTHAQNGDAVVNFVIEILKSVFWFNPLIYTSARHCRLDQEMACDERTIGLFPQQKKQYCLALLKDYGIGSNAPFACQWNYEHPVKTRVQSLTNAKRRSINKHIATSVITMFTVLCALSSWAMQPPTIEYVANNSNQNVDPPSASEKKLVKTLPIDEVAMDAFFDAQDIKEELMEEASHNFDSQTEEVQHALPANAISCALKDRDWQELRIITDSDMDVSVSDIVNAVMLDGHDEELESNDCSNIYADYPDTQFEVRFVDQAHASSDSAENIVVTIDTADSAEVITLEDKQGKVRNFMVLRKSIN